MLGSCPWQCSWIAPYHWHTLDDCEALQEAIDSLTDAQLKGQLLGVRYVAAQMPSAKLCMGEEARRREWQERKPGMISDCHSDFNWRRKGYSRYEMSWVINIRDDSRRRSYRTGLLWLDLLQRSCAIFQLKGPMHLLKAL